MAGTTRPKLIDTFTAGCCANCDQLLDGGKPRLYCSPLCEQTASTIRYTRRVIADGRWEQADVKEAIRTRMAMILGGGYPAAARRLTPAQRKEVLERDGGRCQLCGEPGNEIDHIAGSAADLSNLQTLCHQCHGQKTALGFRPAGPAEVEKSRAIWKRVQSPEPLRLCDDDRNWNAIWRGLLSQTKTIWVEIDDDGPAYGEGIPQSQEEAEHADYLRDLAERD
jgi:5-methylcytosine-specific restriction endonuclease McrA